MQMLCTIEMTTQAMYTIEMTTQMLSEMTVQKL